MIYAFDAVGGKIDGKQRQDSASAGIEESPLEDVTRRALADRLAKMEGHLRSVRVRVLSGRCADEMLRRVSAVKAALNQFSAALLDRELESCLETSVAGDADERLGRVTGVLSTPLE